MPSIVKAVDLPDPPSVDLDPYGIDTLADPRPFFRAQLDLPPVVRFSKYDVYGVGQYAPLREVVTDYGRFTAESGVGITDARSPDFRGRPPSALVEVDPPQHTATRKAANRIMSPLIIRKWRSLFEEQARKAMDSILAMGTFEGMRDLIEAIVFNGFPVAMGIRFDADAIRAIGYMSFNQSGPENALYHHGMKVGEPYLDWFMAACQRDAVEPGSIADDFFRAEEAGDLQPGIASNIVRSLVRGGMDTTMSGMANALLELARNPDQFALLKAHPVRIRSVFDEALRTQAPNHIVFRSTVDHEVQLAGNRLRANTKVATFPSAANHDPRQWTDPDRFDIMRNSANVHMSFGAADHNCIGQNIARLEAECMLTELVNRVALFVFLVVLFF